MTPGAALRPRLAELRMQTVSTEVRTLADAERAHIVATLRETNGVVGGRGGAAVRLGVPRTYTDRQDAKTWPREVPRRTE